MVIRRELGLHPEFHPQVALSRQIEPGCPRLKQVHNHPIAIHRHRKRGDQRNATRPAGEATVTIESAAVGFFTFHLHIITPRSPVAALRPGQLVHHNPLQLRCKPRLPGEPQQLGVELEPGDGHAGLPHVCHIRHVIIIVEQFAVAGGAGQIQPFVHNIPPGTQACLQYSGIIHCAMILKGPVQAGQHLISLPVPHLVHPSNAHQC